MATVSTSFTAVGVSAALLVKHGDSFTYDVSGTFVGTVVIEKSQSPDQSFTPTAISATGAASGTIIVSNPDQGTAYFRFRCSAFTSGTIVTSLADAAIVVREFTDANGVNILQLVEGAVLVPSGTVSAPGIAFIEDTNTGLYRVSADKVSVSTGGVDRLIIDSTNVTADGAAGSSLRTVKGFATDRVNVASAATIASLSSSTGAFIKLTGSTATDLQGIAAGTDGKRLTLYNATGQTLTIRHQDAAAAAGAKITTMTGADITTTGNGFAEFIYDTDASPAEWICMYASV